MNCNPRRILSAVLLATSVLTFGVSVQAQNSVGAATRPAITVLDSTKEQDGLVGSVRRVKTETAKIELKDGRTVEGPSQLVELTTYGIKGNRVENTSYPIGSSLVGKEEYKYDARGNITEMTLRDDRGAILSREAYTYEFDKFGNWTRMVTSLVVFENGELKREPVEITYRTLTYYFDDRVAKVVEKPIREPIREPIRVPSVPVPTTQIQQIAVLNVELTAHSTSTDALGEPPAVPNPIITDQKRANDLFLAGYSYLKTEKDREAIKAFKESIKLNPEAAETHYGLGLANFRANRFKDASDSFKKATMLNPKMAKAHYGLALAHQELSNINGLMEEYRILETLDRNLARKLAQTFPQFNFSCRLIMGCP